MTDAVPAQTPKTLGTVLIVGGTGFLGHRMAALIKQRKAYTKLAVVDLRPAKEPLDGVDYHFGDITDYDEMTKILSAVRPDVVMHTASPHFNLDRPLLYKVNVDGTKNLLKVAQEQGVRAFVYTSSASVISDSVTELVAADETYPYCLGDQQPEYYSHTKALAEIAVLAANRPAAHPHFLTAAIRPSGIFGEGDVQLLPNTLAVFYRGQTRFQIGDNNNLFDWTEVTNVCHAHHLAAAGLLATLDRESAGHAALLDTERIDGEPFIITNDQPAYFWDFMRAQWACVGDRTSPAQVFVLPRAAAELLARALEAICRLTFRPKPRLTWAQVKYSCQTRYFDIAKAKARLGYRPVVGLDEGVRRAVAHAVRHGTVNGMPEADKGKVPLKLQMEIARLDAEKAARAS